VIDCVVVGAGQAGLAVSWHLRRLGVEHVVLERGQVGETWRSQRWDSFALNTPVWAGRLPGAADPAAPLDSFLTRDAWIRHLVDYATNFELPIREGIRVQSLVAAGQGPAFVLRTLGPEPEEIAARAVVLASGFLNVGKLPAIAANVPSSVASIHSSSYRRPDQLPPGAVLVVGSAQSGGQIAEDLLDAGRIVYLSASAVARMPRRYRGKDIFEWIVPAGFFDQTVEQLADPGMRFAALPIISGVGRFGHTLSLQFLASRGARLLGRLTGVDGTRLQLEQDLPVAIRTGDRASAEVRAGVDRTIAAQAIDGADHEPDPADEPVADPESFSSPAELDMDRAGIGSIVWSTGVTGDLSWVQLDVTDEHGAPVSEGGRTSVPGVWFMGAPWMRRRASTVIYGVDGDGRAVAEEVAGFLAS
jgi:putative flavoprotein involved in K+ transport